MFKRSTLWVAKISAVVLSICLSGPIIGEGWDQGRVLDGPGAVLPERQRVEPTNGMLEHRLETLLPDLMRETGIDMWLVINREYAEDPVYFSLVPEPVFAARRTTMLVFHDRGPGEDGGVDRLTVNRYPLGNLYESAWAGGDLEEQWQALGDLNRRTQTQKDRHQYVPPLARGRRLDPRSPRASDRNLERRHEEAGGFSPGLGDPVA